MAPEIFRKAGHGKPVDIWAIGVITYVPSIGHPSFAMLNTISQLLLTLWLYAL
jgi:serine/threonine protein kinase